MLPRHWLIPLWALIVSMTAARAQASERESRRGTLLVAGRPEVPPVLYVASGTVTRVRFVDLQEPQARPESALQGRIEVAQLGEGSLVLAPARDLAPGERLLLPVTGRSETGEPLTLMLALVTRQDTVDAEAWVSRARVLPLRTDAADTDGVDAVARRLLASHGPAPTRPRLALGLPDPDQATAHASSGDLRATTGSILQMDGMLSVTVLIQTRRSSFPWRLIRARLEAGCRQESSTGAESLPLHLTSGAAGQYQLHTFSAPLPEGADCFSLTLEEDGPRTLRFEPLRVSP